MKLKEVKIYLIGDAAINQDRQVAYDLVKELYDKVLKKDTKWHHFYELSYNVLRLSKKFLPDVEEILTSHDITYEVEDWVDDSEHVKKYEKIFIPMLNSFSVLGLQDYDNIYPLMDRVFHCFMNHQELKCNQEGSGRWEMDLVSQYAHLRTIYNTMLHVKSKGSVA